MTVHKLLLVIVSLCLLSSQQSLADSADVEKPVSPPPEGLFDRTHDLVTERFNQFIYQIDDTLGGDEAVDVDAQSTARVQLAFSKSGTENTQLKGSIKVRAVLPRSARRLRLLISTEEDLKPPGENSDTQSNTDGLSLALRFIRRARDNGYINFDLGARWRDRKVQMFGRMNFAFDYEHGESQFQSRLTNSLYQYSSSGFENRLRHDLRRTLDDNESVVFRLSSDVLWQDNRHGALISETIGLYTDIDNQRALAFEALARYSTRRNADQPKHYLGSELRVRFRHNFWRDWFFYEFWPGVSWSANNSYQMAFKGYFRIETMIGGY